MIKVFNSPFKVTQKFGINPQIYKKWNLDGHEGLDIIPTTSDWSVHSLPYKGVCVKDIDMKEKGGNYGIFTTIWYPDIEEAWTYCHLSSNSTYVDQEILPSSKIGQMGATGNTTGAHLHLNRFKVDGRGYRLNRNNGFLGGIDPLPFLQKDIGVVSTEEEDKHKLKGIAVLDEYRNTRKAGPEGNWEGYVRALIDSDRRIIGLNAQVASFDTEKEQMINVHKEETKVVKEDMKETYDKDKRIITDRWQSRVESAKINTLKGAGWKTLLNALITKLFRTGGEKDGNQ